MIFKDAITLGFINSNEVINEFKILDRTPQNC